MKLFSSKNKKKPASNSPQKRRENPAAQEYAAEGRQPKKQKRGKRLVRVLAIIIIVIIAGIIAHDIFVQEPEVDPSQTLIKPEKEEDDEEKAEGLEVVEEGWKSSCYTFLLVGVDVVGSNTDTIMVGMLDTAEGTLNMVSIPRDTLTNVSWGIKRLNSVYAYEGMDGLLTRVSQIVGYNVNNYILVDVEAVEKLVDSVGGVDFDVPTNMNYDDPDQNFSVHISKGLQHLNGTQAVGVLRFRDTYSAGDIQRIQVQQDFMKAASSQILTIANVTKVNEWAKIFSEYVDTDLTLNNIIWYGEEFLKLDSESIIFNRVPGNDDCMIAGSSYVSIYLDEWLEVLNSTINPFYEEITAKNLDILVWDSSAKLATSTQGTTYSTSNFG